MKKIIVVIGLIVTQTLVCQENNSQKQWSNSDKLSINDFKIHTSHSNDDIFYSQFVISYEAKGFDFFKKNLNQRVKNLFLKNASSIDTMRTQNLDKEIDFQQLQFDLSEVYTRKFRKRLLENKKKISRGFEILNKINNDITSEFTKARLEMYKETNNGNNLSSVKRWKQLVSSQLDSLYEYRYENKKRIKLKKS